MGTSYINCSNCGIAFPEYRDYIVCSCDEDYCCEECAEEAGYRKEEGRVDEYGDPLSTCNYCRHEDFSEEMINEYLIDKHNTTTEQVKAEMRELYKDSLCNQ